MFEKTTRFDERRRPALKGRISSSAPWRRRVAWRRELARVHARSEKYDAFPIILFSKTYQNLRFFVAKREKVC